MNYWIEKAEREIDLQNLSSLSSISDKLRKIDSEESRDMALAYADLYEAEMTKKSDVMNAIKLAKSSASFFTSIQLPFEATHAQLLVAACISNQGNSKEAIEKYQEALAYARKHESDDQRIKKLIIRINYNIGYVLVRYGDLDRASQYLTLVLDAAIEAKDTLRWAHTLNMIGNIHIRRYEYAEALRYNKEGLFLARRIGSKTTPYMEGAIGSAYMELNQLDSAQVYLQRVVDVRRKEGNLYSLAVGLINLSEVHRQRNQCDLSDQLNSEALSITRTMELKALEVSALVNLCICHNEQQRYPEAFRTAETGIEKLDNGFQFSVAADLYKCASEASSQQGQHEKALNYYMLYKTNTDSLLNEKSEAIIKDLQFKYETAKQNEEISRLREESKIKSIAYRNKILLMATGLLAIVLIASILYFFYRNKLNYVQRRKLEIEQKLLRSQMNPHFIFNAISSIQNFLFDKSDLKTALSYLSNFAELMRQTLEHSREQNITLERELESLENYLSLQKLRYHNSFTYQIQIDPAIDPSELLVPPLIAQPFVENSIEHGQIYRVDGGKVTISFQLLDEVLRLSITDNGIGIENSEKIRVSLNKRKSLSSIITRERLKALSESSKQKFELIIEQITQGGTAVTIDLPKLVTS